MESKEEQEKTLKRYEAMLNRLEQNKEHDVHYDLRKQRLEEIIKTLKEDD